MKKVNKNAILGILAVLAVLVGLLIPALPVAAGTGYSPITVWLGTSSYTVSAEEYATLLASYSQTITGTYGTTNFNYTGVPIYKILEFAFPQIGSLTGYSVLTADSTDYKVIYGPNVMDNTLVKGNDNLIIATSGTENGNPGNNFPKSACSTFTAGNRFNSNVATIRLQYAIQAPVPTNGQIVPTSGWYSGTRNPWQNSNPPALGVDYNANQTFNITPSSGYHVATLTVDGGAVTPATTYTFSNVTANHTLAATFSNVSVNVYIDPASQSVANGAPFSVNLTINTNQQVRGWMANVTFDATKMSCTGVTEGGFLKDWATAHGGSTLAPGAVTINNTAGNVAIPGWAIMGGDAGGPTGTGTLCTLAFTAKTDVNDFASITPYGVVVSDQNGISIPGVVVTGGTVQIGSLPKPDLVVTEKHEDWLVVGGNYTIGYTIKNQGNAAAGACNTSIAIDGGAPIIIACPALAAGASDSQTTALQTFTGPTDTIVVTADVDNDVVESNEGNNVRQNMLSYYGTLAGVTVDVTGENYTAHASVVDEVVNPAVSYDPLTFMVNVTNTGLLDDKYELTVSDELGWTLKLDPSELFVMAGDSEYAALSVSVPQDTLGGLSDLITVNATGKMATENGIVKGPVASDTIYVTTMEISSVQIELLPGTFQPQTGAPGSPISWLVVVKNTGNVDDTFNLAVLETLTGVSSQSDPRDSWGATFSAQPGTLPAFNKTTSYLKVTIPTDAKTSEWDQLNVTISGFTGSFDSYVVKAHVLEPGPRIPEGVVEITVEDEVVSVSCLGVNSYPFGVMKENETKATGVNFFVIRNTGNVDIDISVRGQDALSMPGEPRAKWILSNSADLDQYAMQLNPKTSWYGATDKDLTTGDQLIWSGVPESEEVNYGLTIRTPTAITTPARMWMRITISAIAS